jgi:L-ribulokinase
LEAAQKMARLKKHSFKPNPQAQKVYDRLYAEYATLHDYFGRGGNDVMKRLKLLKAETRHA